MSRVAQLSPHWGEAGDQVCRDWGGRGTLVLTKTPPAPVIQRQAGYGGSGKGRPASPLNKLSSYDVRMTLSGTRRISPRASPRATVTKVTYARNCGGVLVLIEPIQLRPRQDRHLEALKTQIARCLEKEVSLQAEERRERARQLGIDWEIAERPAEHRRTGYRLFKSAS